MGKLTVKELVPYIKGGNIECLSAASEAKMSEIPPAYELFAPVEMQVQHCSQVGQQQSV